MRATPFLAVALLAAAPVLGGALGCVRESSRGPERWTATDPGSPVGQTAAQAWSRSTSSDRSEPSVTDPLVLVSDIGPVPPGMFGDTLEPPPEDRPGVTNAQPPDAPLRGRSTWPYDGVTLQLGSGPP